MPLKAVALNCTLKRSGGEPSSTDAMIDLLARHFRDHDVELTETIRVADCNVLPGVSSDEGDGDEWPGIRKKVLDADILILGTPVWMGQMSSIAKRVTERMDAFLSETDDASRTPAYGKVAVCAIVGNEDGAHHIADPNAAFGILDGNPIWEEMRDIALRVGESFLINVTLNDSRGITGVFAGEVEAAWLRGVRAAQSAAQAPLRRPVDVVVTTTAGYPLDLTFYQAVKGMVGALPAVKAGGTVTLTFVFRSGARVTATLPVISAENRPS